ncbi:MAG TPA: hypothetical protein VGQ37_03005 [Vicinamibacterales bacterium]|jgi:hypothetical protein|nr:hypothetical protein [Vicinamibacterales bacterium]
MRSWSKLSTLALAGILVATPAYAKKPSVKAEALDDRTAFPYGEAMTRDAMVPPQSAMTEGAIIEGSLDVGDVVRVSFVTGMSG